MNKLSKILVLLLVVVAAVGCGPKQNENPLVKGVLGEWHLTQSPLLTEDTADVVDVYVEFKEDNTFTLYQRDINAPIYYNIYTGTYLITEDIITGQYSDGKSWGAASGYRTTVDTLLGTLTMENVEMPDDLSVFSAEAIPAEVKGGAVRMTTRGEEMFDIVRFF